MVGSIPISNCGGSKMRPAIFSLNAAFFKFAMSRDRARTKGLFAFLLEAMHHSRRLQAERTIGQYRHLIDETDATQPASKAEVRQMSVTERPPYTRSTLRVPAPRRNALLAIIAVAFLAFHIMAIVLLNPSEGAAAPAHQDAKYSSYD
jgi:hypothetical protein